MAEDNIHSPKTGYGFDFDENINPFCSKSKLSRSPSSSICYEDNQNIISSTVTHTSFSIEDTSSKEMASFTTKRKQENDNSSFCNQSNSFDKSPLLSDCKVFSVSRSEHGDEKTSDMSVSENYKIITDCSHMENGINIPNNVVIEKRIHSVVHRRSSLNDDIKVEDLEGAASTETDCKEKLLDFKDLGDIPSNNLGSVSNQSEAGPDVAQFTEEEFRSAAEFFKDPSAFEFLQKAGNSTALQESTLARFSLYVKFDPLLKSDSPVKHQSDNKRIDSSTVKTKCVDDQCVNNQYDENLSPKYLNKSSDRNEQSSIEMVGNMAKQTIGSGKLIDFSPSPKKKETCNPANQQLDNGSSHPLQETKMFSEDEVNQALKMQELLYQEKLIKKDKEWNEKQKTYDKEKQQLKNQNIALKQALAVASFVALEMSKMFSLFKDQKEQERVEMTATNQRLINERDQALEDLQNVETAFADLHRRYEKAKGVLEGYKQNEDKLRDQCSELQDKIKQQEQKFDLLRLRTEEKLESANTELESAKKGVEAEVTVLRAQVKKAEMKISSLERNLEQKNKENAELSNICDELIAKVGKT